MQKVTDIEDIRVKLTNDVQCASFETQIWLHLDRKFEKEKAFEESRSDTFTHTPLQERTVSHCKPRPFRDGPSKVSGCLGVQEESFQHHPEESAEQKEMQHDGYGGACMLYNNNKLKAQCIRIRFHENRISETFLLGYR